MRIVTVVGARPQFIKSLPVSAALSKAGIAELILHTGQHYDPSMSEVFFEQLKLPRPAKNLSVGSGSHARQTAQIMIGLEDYLLEQSPDALLVYGDTNSTVAGALVAAKLHIPIAHVEAGLRSGDWRMPEEINRMVTDRLSRWLFTPTQTANENLLSEGHRPESILEVGDVMFDAFELCSPLKGGGLSILQQVGTDFVLATIHRAENTDETERLMTIIEAFNLIADKTPVVFPVHPRTRAALADKGARIHPHLHMIEPQGYLEMIALLKSCSLVVTDSGGLQKEAFFARKYCLTVRDTTEWVELVQTGWNRLLAVSSAPEMAAAVLANPRPEQPWRPLYGDGTASQKIAQALLG